jgi:hypothetical protein
MSEPVWQTIHIHPAAPPKPAWGEPCNGCGQCCLVEPCPLGMVVSLKRQGACDALRWNEGDRRYVCGLVAQPAEVLGPRWRWLSPLMSRLARRWISAGSGCDAWLESEPPDSRA